MQPTNIGVSLPALRPGPVWGICALGLCLLAPRPAIAEDFTYEHLFTIGTDAGVNPRSRFAGGLGRLIFGGPEHPSPVRIPRAVAVDGTGRIWIADTGSRSIHMFHVLGNEYQEIRRAGKIQLRCPVGVDVDIHGRVYVVDACLREIFVFDRTGEYLRRLLGKQNRKFVAAPSDVAVSIDLRRIYVADPGRRQVLVFNQEGELVSRLGETGGTGGLQAPTRLAVRLKDVYVLDSGTRRVEVFNALGKHIERIRWGPVRRPSAFGIDRDTGLMYVGDPDYETVLVYAGDGRRISLIGQSGDAVDQFHKPYDIYVDQHRRVYVVDSLSRKVVVFRPTFDETALKVSGGRAGQDKP